MELKNSADTQTSNFKASVKKVLGNDVEVRCLTHHALIEVKNLDSITTKEEICNALTKELEYIEELPITSIKSIRRGYGETQIAVISLPFELAGKVTSARRVRIGWSDCSIRLKVSLTKCFKCLGFGHIVQK